MSNVNLLILSNENIKQEERKALKMWTSPREHYKEIKKVAFNKYKKENYDVNDIYIKGFNNLENLFKNYQDNTINFKEIYRVDIIDNTFNMILTNKELFEKFYNLYTIGKEFHFEDIICSFSAHLSCAKKASENSNKYKGINTPQVIYILKKRYSKYLYIEEFSEVINEEEVLTINQGIFQIKNIQIKENNTVEIYIDEILKD